MSDFGFFVAETERRLPVVRWTIWSAGLLALALLNGSAAVCAIGLVVSTAMTIRALRTYERAS